VAFLLAIPTELQAARPFPVTPQGLLAPSLADMIQISLPLPPEVFLPTSQVVLLVPFLDLDLAPLPAALLAVLLPMSPAPAL
jgi:hypothetical protein